MVMVAGRCNQGGTGMVEAGAMDVEVAEAEAEALEATKVEVGEGLEAVAMVISAARCSRGGMAAEATAMAAEAAAMDVARAAVAAADWWVPAEALAAWKGC